MEDAVASGLFGGLFGAVLTLILNHWIMRRERGRRIRGNWDALYVEVKECGRISAAYIDIGIKAPLYRLPTICYEKCFPSLLSDVGLDEDGADTLLKFYSEVQTLNRGLDLLESIRQTGGTDHIDAEFSRARLKANRIAHPSGELYSKALAVCENRRSKPGIAEILG